MEDERTAAKLGADDKKRIVDACDSALKWLDNNATADKDEFEYKLKEVEKVCSPIGTKMYRNGAGPMPGDKSGGARQGPTIDEVD